MTPQRGKSEGKAVDESGARLSERILDATFKALTGLLLLVVGWILGDLKDIRVESREMDSRLSAIESNRYTPRDALEFERSVNKQISLLREQVASMGSDVRVVVELLKKGQDK